MFNSPAGKLIMAKMGSSQEGRRKIGAAAAFVEKCRDADAHAGGGRRGNVAVCSPVLGLHYPCCNIL